jgi:hypothetical protein
MVIDIGPNMVHLVEVIGSALVAIVFIWAFFR